MTEIDIYNKVYYKYNNTLGNGNVLGLIFLSWLIISLFSFLVFLIQAPQYLPNILIGAGSFLLPILIFYFYQYRMIQTLKHKYPYFIKWYKDLDFVSEVSSRMTGRLENDPNSIVIKNKSVKKIDQLIRNHSGDNQRLSNAFYNSLCHSDIRLEAVFYEKFLKFKIRMNKYRPNL